MENYIDSEEHWMDHVNDHYDEIEHRERDQKKLLAKQLWNEIEEKSEETAPPDNK